MPAQQRNGSGDIFRQSAQSTPHDSIKAPLIANIEHIYIMIHNHLYQDFPYSLFNRVWAVFMTEECTYITNPHLAELPTFG